MSIFAAEDSYFKPPKRENSQTKIQSTERTTPSTKPLKILSCGVKSRVEQKKTMEQYNYVLGGLVEKSSQVREVNDIETKELRKYPAYLMDDGLNNTSGAIHYRVLKAFFNCLE